MFQPLLILAIFMVASAAEVQRSDESNSIPQKQINISADDGHGDSAAILYGEAITDPTLYPWVASIYVMPSSGISYACQGSLISTNAVLTTAVCVSDGLDIGNNILGNTVEDVRIKLGGVYSYANHSLETTTYQLFRVADLDYISRHPDFRILGKRGLENDIGLVVLPAGRTATLNENVKTIQLATSAIDYSGRNAEIVGWGQTETGAAASATLKGAVVTVQTDATCGRYWNCDGNDTIYSATTMSCYGGLGQPSVCEGDRGGSVVVRQGGTPVLVAMHSVIRSATEPAGCQRRLRSANSEEEDQQKPGMQGRQSSWLSDFVQRLRGFIARQKKTNEAATTTTTEGMTTTTTTSLPTTTTRPPNLSNCNSDHPVIGVRISNYLDWIIQEING